MIKFNQDFIEIYRDIALTGVGIGFKILTAKYIGRPMAAAAVGALSAYLYPFMYLKDLKL